MKALVPQKKKKSFDFTASSASIKKQGSCCSVVARKKGSHIGKEAATMPSSTGSSSSHSAALTRCHAAVNAKQRAELAAAAPLKYGRRGARGCWREVAAGMTSGYGR